MGNVSALGPPQVKYRFSQMMLWVPLFAIALRLASSPTANASFFLLALYALKGRAQAIQSLALTWLFLMISPAIAPGASLATIGRYAVFLAAGVSVLVHRSPQTSARWTAPVMLTTLMLGSFLVLHSLAFSKMPDVSFLKAASWALVAFTSIAAWSGLSPVQREILQNELFALLTLILLVSLVLLPTALGYPPRGTGYRGAISNPQAFGLTMAILAAWSAVRVVEQPRPPWHLLFIVASSFWMVIMSEARTGAVAFVIGIGVAMALGPVLSGLPVRQLMPGMRAGRVQLAIVLLVGIMIVAWPTISERTDQFLAKRGGESDLLAAYEVSRGPLIETMKKNIQQNLFLGIGFGIASAPELMIVERDPIFGLPTSAKVEKGVMPVAVMEETGLIGALVAALWAWTMLRASARRGMISLALLIVILLLNMGESTLFSPGGAGLLTLVTIGWCVSAREVRRSAH